MGAQIVISIHIDYVRETAQVKANLRSCRVCKHACRRQSVHLISQKLTVVAAQMPPEAGEPPGLPGLASHRLRSHA